MKALITGGGGQLASDLVELLSELKPGLERFETVL